jgi:sulfofructose kinase
MKKPALSLAIPLTYFPPLANCACDHILATQAEVVIISGEFHDREYPRADLTELFTDYQQQARGLVVFTVGGESVLYARKGEPVNNFQPYPVQVIDSAGAGDSLRVGIIYGLLQRWGDGEIIRYASALAAMVCASFPGVLNSPTHAETWNSSRNRLSFDPLVIQ